MALNFTRGSATREMSLATATCERTWPHTNLRASGYEASPQPFGRLMLAASFRRDLLRHILRDFSLRCCTDGYHAQSRLALEHFTSSFTLATNSIM